MNDNIQTPQYAISECVFAWICVLVGYLFCRAFPAEEYPMGTFFVFVIAVSAATAVLVKKNCKFSISSIISAVASVVFSAAPVFTAGHTVAFWSISAAIVAYCFFIYSATDNRTENGFSNFIIVDFFNAAVLYPFASFGKLFPALLSGGHRGFRFAVKLFIGIGIGAVPTAIVASLLAYDDGFSRIMYSFLERLFDLNLFSHIGSLVLGTFIAVLLFGLYYSSVTHEDCGAKAEYCRKFLVTIRIAPCLMVGAAVFPLVAVYTVFFISQIDYYLSAFSGILPETLSYATYAREGFFQLCQVSGINLFLLSVISLISRRDSKASNAFLKILKILLSVITLVLIATAMSKMVLYIRTYGLTEKRVLSSWFMVVIAAVFLIVIIKQFVPKLKTVAASVCVAALMFAVLAFSDYSAVIANYNVDKYIDGELKTVDIGALSLQGESAIPAMVRLARHYESQLKDPELSHEEFMKIRSDAQQLSLYIQVGEKQGADKFFGFSIPYINALNEVKEYKN